jgi:hypothetical protein
VVREGRLLTVDLDKLVNSQRACMLRLIGAR